MDIRYIASGGYDFYTEPCIPTVVSGTSGGYIELEFGWQLCAVDVRYGYWDPSSHRHIHDGITVAKFKNYILDQITDLYGSGVVEVSNTYLGDNQFFYSYVVGSTPIDSVHNWQLVYEDSGYYEISGFWIKVIGSSAPYTISWGNV